VVEEKFSGGREVLGAIEVSRTAPFRAPESDV
jgi:hypothetical protein